MLARNVDKVLKQPDRWDKTPNLIQQVLLTV